MKLATLNMTIYFKCCNPNFFIYQSSETILTLIYNMKHYYITSELATGKSTTINALVLLMVYLIFLESVLLQVPTVVLQPFL